MLGLPDFLCVWLLHSARHPQGETNEAPDEAVYDATLRNHFGVLLGHRRASEINSGDIETMVADITAGKTAKDEKVAPSKRIIVRCGEGAARKVVRDVSAVCSFEARPCQPSVHRDLRACAARSVP